MKYSDPKADLRTYMPAVHRKAIIVTLLSLILLFLAFQQARVKPLKTQEYQIAIQVEDVPITKQEIQKQQEPQRQQLAEVIEADEEEEAIDTFDFISEINVNQPPPPPPAEIEEIEWVKVEKKPEVLSNPKPRYPDIAKRSGLEGTVIIEFVIDTTGNVLPNSAKVKAARPEGIFEEAALEAIYQWKFSPGMQRDRKVRVRWQQPIKFQLK